MAQMGAGLSHSMVTTAFDIDGYEVVRNLGVVRGIVVRSRSIFGTIGAGLQTIVGGNITILTDLCEQTRQHAYDLLVQHANQMGANAVIGFRYVGGGCVEAEVWQAAREVMESEKPKSLSFNLNNNPSYDTGLVCGGTLEVFVEPILPISELLLFGAGHVAQSVANIASLAGFEVTVVDDREAYANRERFPSAMEVLVNEFDAAVKKIEPRENSYIVIVTRGHRDDMRILRWAVTTRARYIGMIGSRRKVATIYKELEKEGVPASSFECVNAPVGLEIGAVTPEEIAVAIVAEMIACKRKVDVAGTSKRWTNS